MGRPKLHAAAAGVAVGVLTLALVTGSAIAEGLGAPRAVELPPLPAKKGCYTYSAPSWKHKKCLSKAYTNRYVPRPELLAGIAAGELVSGPPGTPPTYLPSAIGINSSQLEADTILGEPYLEEDPSWGRGFYTLQDNTNFFMGTNGDDDGVQFTANVGLRGLPQNRASPFPESEVCVWQVKAPFNESKNYDKVCTMLVGPAPSPYSPELPDMVIGSATGGMLQTIVQTYDGETVAVVAPDKYGLGLGGRWNNGSGSILGFGNGSQAVFLPGTEEQVFLAISSCVIGQTPLNCLPGNLEPKAFPDFAPNPITNSAGTLETNNLVPVEGSVPTVLPPLHWGGPDEAFIGYVATPSGSCSKGSPPFCE